MHGKPHFQVEADLVRQHGDGRRQAVRLGMAAMDVQADGHPLRRSDPVRTGAMSIATYLAVVAVAWLVDRRPGRVA